MASRRRSRAVRRNIERQRANRAAVTAGIEALEEAPKRRRYSRTKTALEILAGRGAISPDQLRAGDRFHRDYRVSRTLPGGAIGHYDGLGMPMPDKRQAAFGQADTPQALAARERFEAAIVAVICRPAPS